MKHLIVLLGLCILSCSINAQTAFKIPENIKLDKGEDYPKYNKDIVACVKWLETHPMGENVEERKNNNAFLMIWITGSPDVSITIYSFMMDYSISDGDLMILFMGGWTRHVIETGDKTEVGGCVAGLETVAKFYKSGTSGLAANKKLDKLVELMEKGKMEGFVKDQIKAEKKKAEK